MEKTQYYVKDGVLYHYGIPGMKWGHRKAQPAVAQAKQRYKDAKKAAKAADRNWRNAQTVERHFASRAVGIKGIQRHKTFERNAEQARNKAANAYANSAASKAKLKAAMSKNAEKAEFKAYKKAMRKYGIRGSAADTQGGGKATAVYNKMKAEKGKAYADKVEKRVQNEAVATFVAGTALMVGSAFASAYLNR